MASLLSLFVSLIPFFSWPAAAASPARDGVVGVIYALGTPDLPPPKKVADALVSAGVPRVLLIDPYPEGVAAFDSTGIRVTIGINNSHIPAIAKNSTEAFLWVGTNIQQPNVTVEAVSLGYSVYNGYPDLAPLLLPALKNLHTALTKADIDVPVTTCNSYDLVGSGFPPSKAEFNKSLAATYVKPLLAFLNSTRSPFLTDAFPIKLYRSGVVKLTSTGVLNFGADESSYLTDDATGLTYSNLFDSMVDAVVTAMTKLGYDDIPVVVSGTGWPSVGASNEPEASVLYAAEYNERLVVKQNMREGTPLRPGTTPLAYIYALFDDPRNKGDEFEGNWGIWTAELQQKYTIDFNPMNRGVGGRGLPGKKLLFAGWIVWVVFFSFFCE
ncbi:hypothetical protein Taro_009001 [Colocasia esculenta]|uniref:Glucan endo-1,3-beta-D-glucosidase n=1 Tax=Colocasia esculenta TaxID=4460 RepID=A0A843TYX8_COLES|nr:hypothetical protein [Colocasia esculenta]